MTVFVVWCCRSSRLADLPEQGDNHLSHDITNKTEIKVVTQPIDVSMSRQCGLLASSELTVSDAEKYYCYFCHDSTVNTMEVTF